MSAQNLSQEISQCIETTLIELAEFAVQIRTHHQRATQAAEKAIGHARSAGEYLIQAKARIRRGKWLPWLQANCHLSERTAQAYMRLARELPKLDVAKAQRVADLPLRQAMAELAAPRGTDEPAPTDPVRLTVAAALPLMNTVLTLGIPELMQACDSGDIDLTRASEIARLEPERQRDILEVRTSGVVQMSGEYEWYTPPKYVEAARKAMGGIDLDPASREIANRTVRAKRYYTQEDDGLAKKWSGRVFCNPPYSSREIVQFCERMVEAYDGQEIEQGILLTSNSTDTGWWHTTFRAAKVACLTQGRIGFLQADGEPVDNNRQGSTFFYFGPHSPGFFDAFASIGTLIQPLP